PTRRSSDLGVSRYSGGKFSNFTQRDGLTEKNIRSLSFDLHGQLWTATRTSVAVLRNNFFTSYPLPEKYPLMRIRTVRANFDSNLWLGTDQGVLKFLPETGVWSDDLSLHEEI